MKSAVAYEALYRSEMARDMDLILTALGLKVFTISHKNFYK